MKNKTMVNRSEVIKYVVKNIRRDFLAPIFFDKYELSKANNAIRNPVRPNMMMNNSGIPKISPIIRSELETQLLKIENNKVAMMVYFIKTLFAIMDFKVLTLAQKPSFDLFSFGWLSGILNVQTKTMMAK